MITRRLTGAALAALFTLTTHLSAAPSAAPGYATSLFYTHANADRIVSYDWAGASDVYYQTSTASFDYGGFFRWSGPAPVELQNGSAAPFAGASVVTIGDSVYFNLGTFSSTPIDKYGPLSDHPALTQISTTANYALFGHSGDLFITGAVNFGPNQIFYSDLDGSGNLVSNPAVSLGTTGGGSGPLAFDAAGDLFFAPGYSDKSIYRWSAAQVIAAIAHPTANALTLTGQLWADYSALYPLQSGATSMLVEADGDVLVTVTDFTNPSVLARFDAAPDGSYVGTSETILIDTALLGELRTHDGGLYISSENAIYQIVPEPAAAALLALGGAVIALRRRRS